MEQRRVKFIWGASQVIRGRWHLGLFGFYDRFEGARDTGLAISVRGLLAWTSAMAVVVYLAGATVLFWIWNRNPYSLLTYGDAVLYPVRHEAITEKKGQAFIAQGQELFRAKRWHEAANLLRLGLARHPRDLRARLTLAQYYLLLNQRPLALRSLQEGLGTEYPGRAYLETLFNLAQQGEDHDLVSQTAARYATQLRSDGPATDLRWVNGRRFVALMGAHRAADALAVAEGEEQGDTASEHRVLALLALGRGAEAAKLLAAWERQPGANRGLVLRLQVRVFREVGQFTEMEAALAELRRLNPGDPTPLVYAVVQQAMAGRRAEANAALDDFLFRFGGTAENLALLAPPLGEIHELDLLQRVADAAAERGFPLRNFQTLLVQTRLHRGEWEAAARTLAAIPPATGRDAGADDYWRQWMQRLIEHARLPSDATQTALLEFLRQRPWPLQVFRQSIEVAQRAGRTETAREIAAMALRAFPSSQWLQAQTAAPTSEAGAALAASPGDAQNLPAQLVEVRARHAAGDVPGALKLARLYLNGDQVRSNQMLDVARGIFASGDQPTARTLVQEVLQRSPGFAPARRLLLEWGAVEPK